MTISKIIHFMWLDKNNVDRIPEKYTKNIQTFIDMNPTYTIRYWYNTNTENLLQLYPKYYNFYKSLPRVINKCDFARMIILYHYGGIYSDLDFYCVRSIDDLLTKDLIIVEEPKEHLYTGVKQMFNGFVGCNKNNDFILGYIEYMINNVNIRSLDVLATTGPIQFYKYYNYYISNNPDSITLTDSCYIIPYNDKHKISSKCYNKIINPYVYTLWNEGSGYQHEYNYIFYPICFIVIIVMFYFIYIKCFKRITY